MRVVLDTNILISACLKPAGLEARVVELACAGILEACMTEEVESEYREVLSRDKFRQWRERAETILEAFAKRAVRVTATQPLQVAMDEDDNRFLECACAAQAGFLITGNLRHYPPDWAGTKVVNARQFFDTEWMPDDAISKA